MVNSAAFFRLKHHCHSCTSTALMQFKSKVSLGRCVLFAFMRRSIFSRWVLPLRVLKSSGWSCDVKGLSVCFLVPWFIARAKERRCGALNSLRITAQQMLHWPNNNKTAAGRSNDQYQPRQTPYIFPSFNFFLSSFVCLSLHLPCSFSRKERETQCS